MRDPLPQINWPDWITNLGIAIVGGIVTAIAMLMRFTKSNADRDGAIRSLQEADGRHEEKFKTVDAKLDRVLESTARIEGKLRP